ncbi:MAG: methyltransferase [Caulobacteraceae bacterium]|nr:methyltransferase [Caulobacteraceae bacterium]
MLTPIEDADDERIAAYRDIRERDLVGRQGRFIAEGEVVLRTMAASPLVRPLSLLVARHRLGRIADVVEALGPETPVYVAPQPVLDAIAGFHLHRGFLALGERVSPPDAGQLLAGLPPRAVVVALFGIGNHDNMGGLFRNAAAFGVDAVLLDTTSCDPLYRKAIRVSVGAVLRTPFARIGEGSDPVALLAGAGFEVFALSPSGAERLAQVERAPRTAVLFGSEGPGLDSEILRRVRGVAIPMAHGFDSLNVATTSGIVLHHIVCGV